MPYDKDQDFDESPIRDTYFPDDSVSAVTGPEVTNVVVQMNNSMTAEKRTAQRFLDGVERNLEATGKPGLGKVADDMGITLHQIRDSKGMKAAIERLTSTATVTKEVRAALLKAGMIRMFVESVESPDLDERRHALQVGKVLMTDPELNMTAQIPLVSIDLGELKGSLENLTLPGISAPQQEKEEKEKE